MPGNFVDHACKGILPPITWKKITFHKRDFPLLQTGKILSLNGTKNLVRFPSQHRFFPVPGRFNQKNPGIS
jgi:hypothetical protein